jgi:hypothetical protein
MKKIRSMFALAAIYTVCGILLVSCGGGSGSSNSSANTEIINGIAVPPEPDPVQNNATIAGVDANDNGVRDDVERRAAINANSDNNPRRTMALLKMMQYQLNGNTQPPTTEEWKIILCQTGGVDLGINIILNTKERLSAAGKMPTPDVPSIDCGV